MKLFPTPGMSDRQSFPPDRVRQLEGDEGGLAWPTQAGTTGAGMNSTG